ncbi:expressed unknown protein [Seminavis robusta]|uniref:Uncharacterized protein n=1 Tax=Seminavis robusta TaxID=568900 RepID=A0A9N8D8Z9_9STRA|nr:expressed unknown protein [Seminavis robusta]|eukprot:Sro40_g024760.1 n/a (270) ;mRNA; f:95797-96746
MTAKVSSQEQIQKQKRLADLEAKAVAEAKASADASFRPSPSLLNASSAEALMSQVDGPSLGTYEGKESVYVGRAVPVAAGGKLEVPIQVTSPGSVVEYFIEIKTYDLAVSITAERDEGVTIVKKTSRVDSTQSPLTQKFLVGTVPCLVNFKFDNEFSWMREKVLSYKITVTPPSKDSLASGRRRRAKACIQAVEDDMKSAEQRLEAATQQKTSLAKNIEKLSKELEEKKKSLQGCQKEEDWLKQRVALRKDQQKLLTTRLTNGWPDEGK